MANLYGVANGPCQPVVVQLIGGGNITCPGSGAETNLFNLTLPPPNSPGFFYAIGTIVICCEVGATAMSYTAWGCRYNNGADSFQFPFPITSWGANVLSSVTLPFVGNSTIWNNPPTGTTIQVSLIPSAAGCTVMFNGSMLYAYWQRYIDQ